MGVKPAVEAIAASDVQATPEIVNEVDAAIAGNGQGVTRAVRHRTVDAEALRLAEGD
jgi:hypothetical protein